MGKRLHEETVLALSDEISKSILDKDLLAGEVSFTFNLPKQKLSEIASL
jgi:hypothetical protein